MVCVVCSCCATSPYRKVCRVKEGIESRDTLFVRFEFHRPVSIVSASSFYWLRQLQRSRRSLDTESAATLVKSFVASRIDYCNAVLGLLAVAPKATTNKLQRVLNAAARVVSGTHKFDRGLTRLLHTELHWLDVPERVVYKLGVMVFNCLHGQAPQYLMELCQPVAASQVSHHGNIFDLPPNSSWSYRVTSSAPIWPTGFLCGWSVGLEFPAGQLKESDYWREQASKQASLFARSINTKI